MESKFFGVMTSVSLLIYRLILALVFIPAGWGKLQNLQKPISFFETLGIPFPSYVAPMVGTFEFFCGVMLLLGLMTRMFSIPLIVIMAVAILTAKLPEVTSIRDLAGITEFLYLALSMMLFSFGGGRFSFDSLFNNVHIWKNREI